MKLLEILKLIGVKDGQHLFWFDKKTKFWGMNKMDINKMPAQELQKAGTKKLKWRKAYSKVER